MNRNWGYAQDDYDFKPAPMIIRKLVECVSKGGNMLLNVGPDARGNIPGESIEILEEVGAWMEKNSESVYGCGMAGISKPDFGRYTRKGDTLYCHVWDNTIGPIPITGVPKQDVLHARLLSSGAELNIRGDWTTNNYPNPFVKISASPYLPDDSDTVIAVTLKK